MAYDESNYLQGRFQGHQQGQQQEQDQLVAQLGFPPERFMPPEGDHWTMGKLTSKKFVLGLKENQGCLRCGTLPPQGQRPHYWKHCRALCAWCHGQGHIGDGCPQLYCSMRSWARKTTDNTMKALGQQVHFDPTDVQGMLLQAASYGRMVNGKFQWRGQDQGQDQGQTHIRSSSPGDSSRHRGARSSGYPSSSYSTHDEGHRPSGGRRRKAEDDESDEDYSRSRSRRLRRDDDRVGQDLRDKDYERLQRDVQRIRRERDDLRRGKKDLEDRVRTLEADFDRKVERGRAEGHQQGRDDGYKLGKEDGCQEALPLGYRSGRSDERTLQSAWKQAQQHYVRFGSLQLFNNVEKMEDNLKLRFNRTHGRLEDAPLNRGAPSAQQLPLVASRVYQGVYQPEVDTEGLTVTSAPSASQGQGNQA